MTAAHVLMLQLAAAAAIQSSYDDVAAFAIDRLTESFGPLPSSAGAPLPAQPWLATPQGMEGEAEVVRAIAQRWWGDRVRFDAASRDFGEGLVLYLHSRIVEDVFDRRWQFRAYALDVRRYFGAFIPWQLRTIPVSRDSVGVARDVYLGRPHSRWRRNVTPAMARTALGFASLERRYTWPVLERGLRAVAQLYSGKTIDRHAFGTTLSNALGVDVSATAPIMTAEGEVASRIDRVMSEPCAPAPCVRTAIDAAASGESAWPVRLRFADAPDVTTTWRAVSGATLWFESASAPLAVSIDAEQTNLLDRDYRDNVVVTRPSTDVPVRKWIAQWLMWLQHIMLTYAAVL